MTILTLNEIYSLIFFVVAAAYFFVGTYILSTNINSPLNRVFFFIAFLLGTWAFSYSLATSAKSLEEAIFWNRVSVVGWGLVYSVILHYFLLLTERWRILRNKFNYILIYGFSMINLYAFGLSSKMVHQQLVLIRTQAGWVDASQITLLDYYFYLYYVLTSAACLFCLWTWGKKKMERNDRNTVLLISFSFVLAVALGSFTDVILKTTPSDSTPHLGVVFAILPISTILYSIMQYGTFIEVEHSKLLDSNKILTKEKRYNFFKLVSIVAFIGGFLNIGLCYGLFGQEITSVIRFSGFFIALGSFLWMIPDLHISERVQDILLEGFLVLLIPILTVHYNQNAYNSIIWTVPILLMILVTLFNNRIIVYLLLLSAICVEVWLYFSKGSFAVIIEKADYHQRLLIYLLLAAIVKYVNYLYMERLKDYNRQIRLQRMISRISSELVSVNSSSLYTKIQEIFSVCGEFFCLEHGYLFLFETDREEAHLTCEWWKEEANERVRTPERVLTEEFPYWAETLRNRSQVCVADVDRDLKEHREEEQLMKRQHIKSVILVPVASQGQVQGFIGFDHVADKRNWKSEDQEVMQILANILSDAISKVRAEEKIEFMAYYDQLTGLVNRTYFNMEADRMIQLARRRKEHVGILFLDLDSFKTVNDTMGHKAGDQLLTLIGNRLSRVVRSSDIVCRFGGDEFLIMLCDMDEPDQIRIAAEKIMGVFEEPVEISEQVFHVKASCGVSIYPVDGRDVETLLKSADMAMYEAKKEGKNRMTYCTPVMKEAVQKKVQLSNELYRALEKGELIVHYQPQIHIESEEIIGVEALVRWNHPERGVLYPKSFIELAEQTGLIHPIGEWILKTACRQNREWQEKGYQPMMMAINLSMEQFRGPSLLNLVEKALKESGLEAKYLELEITESIAVREPEYVVEILHSLKKLGVSISIDDFGTEYSSLSRLKELPIDHLKMAMEFVHGIDKGTKDEAIVVIIIDLARRLGLKVIAEGVEKESQLKFLKNRVCDEVQGYYYYRPMPAEEIEKILKKR